MIKQTIEKLAYQIILSDIKSKHFVTTPTKQREKLTRIVEMLSICDLSAFIRSSIESTRCKNRPIISYIPRIRKHGEGEVVQQEAP